MMPSSSNPVHGLLRLALVQAALSVWLCLGTIAPALAQVQSELQQPAQSQTQKLINAPMPADLGKDNRTYMPGRVFGGSSPNTTGLELREKPSSPAEMKLFTTIETKVENKTQNYIDGKGASTSAGRPGGEPAPAAQGAFVGDPGMQLQQGGLPWSDWVGQTLGQKLSVLGSDWFNAGGQTALDPMTVPHDYRIGPGDELLIRAWGQIDIDFQGAVDRSGQIFLPKVGTVTVAGLSLENLTQTIKTTVSRQYKSFEMTVSLGKLRQIQYYVMGFVQKPGVYSAPSTASALYGLMNAGGVQAFGDLRRIELRRDGKTVTTLDAYRFLVDGDRSQDPQLQPGDVLYVPTAQGLAAIAGGVRRPTIVHLAAGSTLEELMRIAGGLSIPQQQPALRIERFEGTQRVVESLVYNDVTAKRKVSDGELLLVLPPSPKIASTVTLRGYVAQPLRHSWFDGMRVSDLLGKPDDLVRPSSWIKRNERDTLSKLGRADRDNDFKRDFPEVNWEYAAIERLDPQSTKSTLLPFDLGMAMRKNPEHDLKLQPGDTVVVFARDDFQQPQAKRYKVVRIEGEVKVPGVYPIAEGESLAQVLQRAGGLMPDAYLMGTVLVRQSAKKQESDRLRMVVDRIERDALRFLSSRSRYAVNPEESMSSSNEIESVQQLIGRLRGVQAQGRIPLPWTSMNATLSSLPAIPLEDEDSIYIPHRPSTVVVVGAVFQEGSQLWEKSSTVSDYLERAGGFQRYADKSAVVLVRADGSVRKVSGWFGGNHVVYPGDTLLVPEDVRSSGWTKTFKDWTQIFYQLGLGAAALKILSGGQL